jgi:perosamine synthetase
MVALGIGAGDEVIVPDVTFIATANAVKMAGANPVLVDVETESLNISPKQIQAAITPRTKAILPVHISGRAVDLDAVQEIADAHDLILVEDAAQSLLSRHNKRCLGTFGVAGCVSFSPNKTITTGQGGAVLTNDDSLHVRLRELKDQGRPMRGTASADIHPSVGFNFKFTNLQAAVGLAQLARLPQRVEAIRQLYFAYRDDLADISAVRLFTFGAEEAPQWVDAIVEDREALFAYLAKRDIHCRRYWYPIHTQPPYRQPDEQFPNSSHLIPQSLWFPSAFSLTVDDVKEVCRHVREFYTRQPAIRTSAVRTSKA